MVYNREVGLDQSVIFYITFYNLQHNVLCSWALSCYLQVVESSGTEKPHQLAKTEASTQGLTALPVLDGKLKGDGMY